jgi:restriction system protein
VAIPDYQSLTLPVLKKAALGEAKISEVVEQLAAEFALTSDEQSALLPSGRQTTFANRAHWAKTYLGQAGLIESTGRGRFRITEEGRRVLATSLKRIDVKFLDQYPQFKAFRQTRQPEHDRIEARDVTTSTNVELTPDETMRVAQRRLETELGRELLKRIILAPPVFFERLVITLLTAMGYGGAIANAARALGRSGDGGVDGVVDQDPLGLDRVYVQAKRYGENAVGPSAIRDFFGAPDQFKAAKGLFITTSTFSDAATRTAKDMSKRIVLINGDELTRLMIQYGVGCRIEETLFVKKIDEEYFED